MGTIIESSQEKLVTNFSGTSHFHSALYSSLGVNHFWILLKNRKNILRSNIISGQNPYRTKSRTALDELSILHDHSLVGQDRLQWKFALSSG